MQVTRRKFCGALLAASFCGSVSAAPGGTIPVVDMMGRQVMLPSLPKRIVLLEAHDMLTMSLLHPDPSSLVVGWAAVDRIDSEELQQSLAGGRKIAVVGKQTPDTISIEGLIGLSPDLVVTNTFMAPHGEADPLVQQLTKFGIPIVFSDTSNNLKTSQTTENPIDALPGYMRMWGRLLGHEEKAAAFTAFFDDELRQISDHLLGVAPVTTYLEVQSTSDDCCWAAGQKIWGRLLTLAGGRTLPDVTADWYQKLSLEYLLSTPHDVYIATGGGWASGLRPAIGPGLDPALGEQGLKRLVDGRTGFSQLASVRNHRVHGIWSGLITNLPLNILFVATAAKWLHPVECRDLDPDSILDAINRDFASVIIKGPLWASLTG